MFFIPFKPRMGFFMFFLAVFFLFSVSYGVSFSEFIYPSFSASDFQSVDNKGSFLLSRNGTFKAAVFSPGVEGTNFYMCVIHVPSNTIIWSANRDAPISNSGRMNFTVKGITIFDHDGNLIWSTPPLRSSAYALWLTEMGNLVLLDQVNGSLWESFHYPTDTLVIGQHLPVGASLSSAVSSLDLSAGDYKLTISANDAVFQWHGSTYWELSMESKAYRNSNYFVEYMEINRTGLYLLGRNGSIVIVQVVLSPSDFRIAKLDASGHFTLSSFSGGSWNQELVEPVNGCLVPSICGRSGLCKAGAVIGSPSCSCPAGFHVGAQNSSGCVPSSGSYSFPLTCNSSSSHNQLNSSIVSYLSLGSGVKYFSNTFSKPVQYNVNFSVCEDICSRNCSCLGVFYENSSGSCYMLEDELGSFMSSSSFENDLLGYVKVVVGSSPPDNQMQEFPIAAVVLLPFTGFFLLVALGFLFWRRWRLLKTKGVKPVCTDSPASRELDVFYIPGLPKRFEYKELEAGTENFKTLIGSGGFGSVYKGELYDKSIVAVKKITNSGVQGKKEFFTEIAVIGNVHHVNLVKLKGFCAQGSQRLLVYEYMNHGSLDRTLFGSGPALEWQERLDIVLGTARGLAYLHGGCAHKIIHCDIKPENILLQDHFQAKISDFGLSKLLNPEQSSLFTTMRGTRGYLAPEWLTSSAISEKTDVYSFGMVLLEIVSGRKNCSLQTKSHSLDQNSSSDGGQSSPSSGLGLGYFPLFALEKHEQGRYMDLADPRLEGRVTSEEVEKLVVVALTCVHEEPALRPNMKTVVGMLEGGIPLGKPRMESLNFLRFYGRRFTEASMIEEGNEQNGTVLLNRQMDSQNNTESAQVASLCRMSSEQISGPR